ncbi:Protein of unknown function [Bacillus cereus]|nr:Protein of unknown function [Bacillus cereus]
MMTMTTIIT